MNRIFIAFFFLLAGAGCTLIETSGDVAVTNSCPVEANVCL